MVLNNTLLFGKLKKKNIKNHEVNENKMFTETFKI